MEWLPYDADTLAEAVLCNNKSEDKIQNYFRSSSSKNSHVQISSNSRMYVIDRRSDSTLKLKF